MFEQFKSWGPAFGTELPAYFNRPEPPTEKPAGIDVVFQIDAGIALMAGKNTAGYHTLRVDATTLSDARGQKLIQIRKVYKHNEEEGGSRDIWLDYKAFPAEARAILDEPTEEALFALLDYLIALDEIRDQPLLVGEAHSHNGLTVEDDDLDAC